MHAKGVPVKIGDYETHPAADLLPLLSGSEYQALCKSIIERGLEKPIELYDGKVLDGRNRLRACLEMRREPSFVAWAGRDPYEYVWAHNAVRRHLEPGQRAAIRLRFDAALRELAEERRAQANAARATTQRRRRRDGDSAPQRVTPVSPSGDPGPTPEQRKTRAELARRADVSPMTAQKAITVQQRAPELFDQGRIGAGNWLRGQTEHALLAVRGQPVVNLTNESTLLRAPPGAHSEKPEAFYELVERLCPGSRLELFARRPRDGWAAWGSEVAHQAEAAG